MYLIKSNWRLIFRFYIFGDDFSYITLIIFVITRGHVKHLFGFATDLKPHTVDALLTKKSKDELNLEGWCML